MAVASVNQHEDGTDSAIPAGDRKHPRIDFAPTWNQSDFGRTVAHRQPNTGPSSRLDRCLRRVRFAVVLGRLHSAVHFIDRLCVAKTGCALESHAIPAAPSTQKLVPHGRHRLRICRRYPDHNRRRTKNSRKRPLAYRCRSRPVGSPLGGCGKRVFA